MTVEIYVKKELREVMDDRIKFDNENRIINIDEFHNLYSSITNVNKANEISNVHFPELDNIGCDWAYLQIYKEDVFVKTNKGAANFTKITNEFIRKNIPLDELFTGQFDRIKEEILEVYNESYGEIEEVVAYVNKLKNSFERDILHYIDCDILIVNYL